MKHIGMNTLGPDMKTPVASYMIPRPGGPGAGTEILLTFPHQHALLSQPGGIYKQIPRLQAARILWTLREQRRRGLV